MSGLIDYAGLFPPAQLPLDKAITNYARYRQAPDRWMLSRFIIPATRLPDLTTLAEQGQVDFTEHPPFVFSILGRGGADDETFLHGLREDLQGVGMFAHRHGSNVKLDVLETRLPATMTTAAQMRDLLPAATEAIAATGEMRLFCEVPAGPDWSRRVEAAVEGMASHNRRQNRNPVGFKLRCGGVEASAFPLPEEIALALIICRDTGVALKATAGLHHPLRHYNDSVQTKMHGFINVFGAGILAHVHQLTLADLQPILAEETAAHFVFTDEAFTWQHLQATTGQITALRETALISYGSCSFDEPREDLRELGLL